MKELSDEEIDKLTEDFVIGYFKSVGPREWHLSASDWNYDSGREALRWIINNPETEKATALMIYWMSAPAWQKQFADRDDAVAKNSWYAGSYDFIEEIENNYTSGFYTRETIGYDPANDDEGYDWTSDYDDITRLREIPAIMYEKIEGEQLARPEDYEDGLPVPVYEKLIELYEQYGIL